jgi:hypothetical protein
MPTLIRLVSDPDNPGYAKEETYEVSQAEIDEVVAEGQARNADQRAQADVVTSREIREALTQEERRSLRNSDNLDVQDVYEEVITMGDYRIRRDDPKLAQMLTLVRSVFPEHTFDGLEQLFQST